MAITNERTKYDENAMRIYSSINLVDEIFFTVINFKDEKQSQIGLHLTLLKY